MIFTPHLLPFFIFKYSRCKRSSSHLIPHSRAYSQYPILHLSMAQVPLTTHSSTPRPRAEKRFRFGSQTLDLYQPFAFKFMEKQKTALTDVHKCIIDNLWRSSKEPRYFTATINCLAEYFISTTPKKNAYVVYQGRKPGVFKNWSDVVA